MMLAWAWWRQQWWPRQEDCDTQARPGHRAAASGTPSRPAPGRERGATLPSAPRAPAMVGHLHLQGMEESLKERSREGLLDSPDSGLPPSPSPPFYALSPDGRAAGGSAIPTDPSAVAPQEGRESVHPGFGDQSSGVCDNHLLLLDHLRLAKPQVPCAFPCTLVPEMRPRMYPVFFGESIEVNPQPGQEIRWNSEVKYDSEKHYRDDIFYVPVPTVTSFSETIIATPNCTWRNYKTQLHLEPRPRPLRFQTTTIIYPKHAKNTFRTTLRCSLGCPKRWFASSVRLELWEEPGGCALCPEDL
ncbi:refilin-A isoform X2 [Ornithorhynchus anatinus]|uniref:refilin-A isoform X2 n=1 Tax=Ornithorhynchus anatinus TaxID=9258 RepID=UPI0010A810CE|nr:refilin-A isoform X2 [Ornithorhynchus anatinus]